MDNFLLLNGIQLLEDACLDKKNGQSTRQLHWLHRQKRINTEARRLCCMQPDNSTHAIFTQSNQRKQMTYQCSTWSWSYTLVFVKNKFKYLNTNQNKWYKPVNGFTVLLMQFIEAVKELLKMEVFASTDRINATSPMHPDYCERKKDGRRTLIIFSLIWQSAQEKHKKEPFRNSIFVWHPKKKPSLLSQVNC